MKIRVKYVIIFIIHNLQLTFPDDDRDGVATLQLPLISNCQGELVRADLQTRHRGNGTVCIFNLHTLRTSKGGRKGQKKKLGWRISYKWTLKSL